MTTKTPGDKSSLSDPTDDSDSMSVTPNFLNASMFAL